MTDSKLSRRRINKQLPVVEFFPLVNTIPQYFGKYFKPVRIGTKLMLNAGICQLNISYNPNKGIKDALSAILASL